MGTESAEFTRKELQALRDRAEHLAKGYTDREVRPLMLELDCADDDDHSAIMQKLDAEGRENEARCRAYKELAILLDRIDGLRARWEAEFCREKG